MRKEVKKCYLCSKYIYIYIIRHLMRAFKLSFAPVLHDFTVQFQAFIGFNTCSFVDRVVSFPVPFFFEHVCQEIVKYKLWFQHLTVVCSQLVNKHPGFTQM